MDTEKVNGMNGTLLAEIGITPGETINGNDKFCLFAQCSLPEKLFARVHENNNNKDCERNIHADISKRNTGQANKRRNINRFVY